MAGTEEEEVWTYGGVRVSGRGQRAYAWIDEAGEELWFPKTGTRSAVGSQYRVTVKRADGVTSIIGTPQYAGRACDDELRRQLWAQHSAATTRLELARAERNDARRNAPDEAIAPLLEVARTMRTTAERDALADYVSRNIADSRRGARHANAALASAPRLIASGWAPQEWDLDTLHGDSAGKIAQARQGLPVGAEQILGHELYRRPVADLVRCGSLGGEQRAVAGLWLAPLVERAGNVYPEPALPFGGRYRRRAQRPCPRDGGAAVAKGLSDADLVERHVGRTESRVR